MLDWVKFFFTPLALAFLLYFAWQSRQSLITVIQNARAVYLAFAIISWTSLHFISPVFVRMILTACGSPMNYRIAFNAHTRNLPARYLPGGVWHTVGRVADFHAHGVKPSQLAAFFFLENLLAAAVTLTAGGASVWYFRGLDRWGSIGALGMLGGIIGLMLAPAIVNWRILKGPDRLPIIIYAKGVGVTAIFWLIAAMAFIFYINSFPLALNRPSIAEIGGTYLFSWGIGYITIFAPQGIGVFETVAGGMLTSPISLCGVVTVVAGFRLIVLLADVIGWGVYRIMKAWS